MGNKLIHMAEFWVKKLGLCFPDDQTKRIGVATIQVASNVDADPTLGYRQLHELQSIIVRYRGSAAMSCQCFPADPHAFWRQYPTAYTTEHPPVPCRIDATLLMHRNNKESIPARRSNKHRQ